MKRLVKLLFPVIVLITFVTTCNETETVPPEDENQEMGYLSLQIGLDIEELPAARLAEINTDDFIVTIHRADDDTEVERFDPFSSAPAEIPLPTGEYYVRATNLEPPANAAFEQPWYFGESAVFNIDKEELKTIDVTCTLANYKVSFVYSQNVLDNFTDWTATASLNTVDYLVWPKTETREGYFNGAPLDIEVYLEYTKVFTGELITRTFTTTITDPQPATHYRINVDASLEDGKIVINLTVDDSFVVVDIDLGDSQATFLKNCKAILTADPGSSDGVYTIDPDGVGGNDPFDCYCDMTTDGGGWTQVWSMSLGASNHPVYGILWNDAINRIPQETSNVYTGLNIWNQIMGGPSAEMRGDFIQNGSLIQSFKATLQAFDPADDYTIKLSNYVQLAGSIQPGLWTYHNNVAFSSVDNDNDNNTGGNCSTFYGNSAFWYNQCWDGNFWGWGGQGGNGFGSYWQGASNIGEGAYFIR
jgi:hypothetical protein